MTHIEAKAVALQSLQAGRNRAKEAVQRVVSYAIENVVKGQPRPDTVAITKFVTEALLNPGHEARVYPKINKMFRKHINDEFLQSCIDQGRIKIRC